MKPLTYKDAGVDIDAGNELVNRIKPLVRRTLRPEVLTDLGGFGGLFAIPPGRYREPVLVSGTDGVGTKLMLAQRLGRHDSIGIDLVAMCVNDVLVQGAEPLFFLDYFACGRLDVGTASDVIAGIAEGCAQAGAALIGGVVDRLHVHSNLVRAAGLEIDLDESEAGKRGQGAVVRARGPTAAPSGSMPCPLAK